MGRDGKERERMRGRENPKGKERERTQRGKRGREDPKQSLTRRDGY